MAAADRAAVDSGTPVEVLMDRAGRAVARTVIEMMGGRYGKRVVVVCGTGNNGGDGFVAARVLQAEGAGVRCLFVGDIAAVDGASLHHLDMARARGVPVGGFDAGRLEGADLIVDAIFGTGFRGSVEGASADAITAINAAGVPVLSIDIPSGLDGSHGVTGPSHVIADATIAIAAEKTGTFLSPPDTVGVVDVVDIGIPVASSSAEVIQARDVAAWLPSLDAVSHKRSRGAVAILAGADEMTGAAALVVRGAFRAGCGYVMVGCTQRVASIVQESCPEAIVYVISDSDHLGPSALDGFRPALEKATAVAIGPGLGRGDDQTKLVERVLADVHLPVVLDADGLNAVAGSTDVLTQRAQRLALTPHPAELARLTGDAVEAIQRDRLAAARAAAASFRCEVLLKGYRSIIATADGITHLNPTGGAQLATAGTGDVLTGMVAAFLAAGNEHALQTAVYLHGLAGELAGGGEDGRGVVAWDVAEALPEAMDLVRGVSL
jgi:NAD(P)H-hydrate epimerase